MDIKGIAQTFRLSISGFAKLTGYSRQALYQMADEKTAVCTPRFYSTLKLLKLQSDKLYQDDLEKAQKEKEEREKVILALCKKVSAINVIEQVE